MLAESVYKWELDNGNFQEFLHRAGGFSTFKTGIPGGPGSDLIEVFKMAKNLSPILLTKLFEMKTDNGTRGQSFKLVKQCCNCEVRRHFFSEIVNCWNMLDQDTVSAKSVNGFKSN